MSIALDLAEGRIAMFQAVDRLEKAQRADVERIERAQRNDYTQFRGEIREIQGDIIGGLEAMRRTVKANETIAAGEVSSIEAAFDRRFSEFEKKFDDFAQKMLTNGSGGHG